MLGFETDLQVAQPVFTLVPRCLRETRLSAIIDRGEFTVVARHPMNLIMHLDSSPGLGGTRVGVALGQVSC